MRALTGGTQKKSKTQMVMLLGRRSHIPFWLKRFVRPLLGLPWSSPSPLCLPAFSRHLFKLNMNLNIYHVSWLCMVWGHKWPHSTQFPCEITAWLKWTEKFAKFSTTLDFLGLGVGLVAKVSRKFGSHTQGSEYSHSPSRSQMANIQNQEGRREQRLRKRREMAVVR